MYKYYSLFVSLQEGPVVTSAYKKGYLHKTGSDRQGWKKRYCAIDGYRGLEYFKSESVSPPALAIL